HIDPGAHELAQLDQHAAHADGEPPEAASVAADALRAPPRYQPGPGHCPQHDLPPQYVEEHQSEGKHDPAVAPSVKAVAFVGLCGRRKDSLCHGSSLLVEGGPEVRAQCDATARPGWLPARRTASRIRGRILGTF